MKFKPISKSSDAQNLYFQCENVFLCIAIIEGNFDCKFIDKETISNIDLDSLPVNDIGYRDFTQTKKNIICLKGDDIFSAKDLLDDSVIIYCYCCPIFDNSLFLFHDGELSDSNKIVLELVGETFE